MDGWRARIGVLIPSGITQTEDAFKAMVPAGVSCHYTRYNFTGGKTGDEKGIMEGLENAINSISAATELIMHMRPSLVVMTGTGTSFVKGHGYDQKLIQLIQSQTGGVPATTTSTAVIKALRLFDAKKISFAAPYVEGAALKAVEFVKAHGIEVLNAKWLGKAGPDMLKVPQEEIYELIRSVDTPDSQAIFVSCTNFDVHNMVDTLENDLGKPVITSNQATMWDILRMLNLRDKICGFGRLLTEY